MAKKRYYWLKLSEGFFRQKPIKKLRKIPGGDTYVLIYLKMLLVSLRQDGRLYFEGVEEDFPQELALDIDEDEEAVRITVSFLIAQGLLQIGNDADYMLPEAREMTGGEAYSTERVRRYREKKSVTCNADVTPVKRLGNEEIEIEKEIEKEKDINIFCPELSNSGPNPADKAQPDEAVADGIIGTSDGAGMMVEKAAEPSSEIFISLPLTGNQVWDVTKDYVAELRELYQAVDVEVQIRKMKGWLDANPRNRKTKKGIKRFITNWLSREQDKAPRVIQDSRPAQSRNRFNNFTQRDNDWDEITRQVMEAQRRNESGS